MRESVARARTGTGRWWASVAVVALAGAAWLAPGAPAAIAAASLAIAVLAAVRAGHRRLGPTRAGLRSWWNDPLVLLGSGFAGGAAGAVTDATTLRIGELHVGDTLLAVGVELLAFGLAGLLDERMRDYALDIELEGLVVATAAAVTTWMLLVEPRLDTVRMATAQLVLLTSLAAAVLVIVLSALRLGVGHGGSPTARAIAAGGALLLAGRVVDLLGGLELLEPQRTPGALTLTGAGLIGVACGHPRISSLRTDRTMAPIRLGFARLSVLVAAVLVVPMIATWRLALDRDVQIRSVLVTSAITSLVVIAYLGGLLREWARIEFRSQHDELTGLPNRRHFYERLALAVANAKRNGGALGVVFLDLDRFKVVNDSLGHAVGNTLLEAVARRISDAVPHDVVPARLQGDEFAILVPDVVVGDDRALGIAEAVLKEIARPYTLSRRKLYVTASAGVAHFPADGDDHEALLRSADTAMYKAKETGRNNAQVHTSEMHDMAVGRLDLESALHGAIERGELSVLYQPKVSLETGTIVGAEALVRWQHPGLGAISPQEFISIAEETGLINPLGEWVLTTACRQLKAWEDGGFPAVSVAVNLSPRQFELQDVAAMLSRVLRSTGADARRLEVELTESLAMQSSARVAATLDELAAMGIRCAIDDFGTGYCRVELPRPVPAVDDQDRQGVRPGDRR